MTATDQFNDQHAHPGSCEYLTLNTQECCSTPIKDTNVLLSCKKLNEKWISSKNLTITNSNGISVKFILFTNVKTDISTLAEYHYQVKDLR